MPPIKKEMMDRLVNEVDVGPQELRRRDVIFHLGELAAAGLSSVGQVTLIMNPSGNVCIANPLHVFMAPESVLDEDTEEVPPFRWVRPVLGSGRPQYAAWRDDQLWEIEFEGEGPPPADNS
jgi:hypothetical protein